MASTYRSSAQIAIASTNSPKRSERKSRVASSPRRKQKQRDARGARSLGDTSILLFRKCYLYITRLWTVTISSKPSNDHVPDRKKKKKENLSTENRSCWRSSKYSRDSLVAILMHQGSGTPSLIASTTPRVTNPSPTMRSNKSPIHLDDSSSSSDRASYSTSSAHSNTVSR